MTEFCIYWAAFVLGMIITANFIAPGMLGYERNLAKVECFFGQVFRVHSAYTVLTMLGMLLLCVCYNQELAEAERGSLAWGLCLYLAVFWGTRVVVQVIYYDEAIKKKYPVFNIIFFTAFAYLAILFTFLTVK